MKINIKTENCNIDKHFLIDESVDSKISIVLELETIVSVQSKKENKNWITSLIQNELSKFKWIIYGQVLIDFTWYINAAEKQETDKIGDIDNISKPIQDSLTGPKGIMIDDSQISVFYSSWISRDDLISDNILRIDLRFNNDYILQKENLVFIQYDGAICMPMNLDINNIKDLFYAKFIIHTKKKTRRFAQKFRRYKKYMYGHLICSNRDFHRTRINKFRTETIYSNNELNKLCLTKGLTFIQLINEIRHLKTKNEIINN